MSLKPSPRKNQKTAEITADRLAAGKGREYWRSLAELSDSAEFRKLIEAEFPSQASELSNPLARREFLRLMAASLALSGIGGACTRQPEERIVPYVRAPEEIVPGKPLFFASSFTLGGFATGILVESHMGRPTKVEGNPSHPASLGASNIFAQASVLTLYDPDRSQVIRRSGRISTWSAFLKAVEADLAQHETRRGRGLRLLTETVTSPSLAAQIQRVLDRFPEAAWHQYEPVGRDQGREGALLAFGRDVQTLYDFSKADVVVSLDAAFLTSGPGCIPYSRAFARRRQPVDGGPEMNRLYAVESTPSTTGAMADHRLPLAAREIEIFAWSLARELGVPVKSSEMTAHEHWMKAVAEDLQKHRGSCLVVPGDYQPPIVHALAHAMNDRLGNVGETVRYTEPVEANPVNQLESLKELTEDMEAGKVDTLVILGGNPVFTAPADLQFAQRLSNVSLRIRLGLYEDETSALCHWHLPQAHYLESWSDARAFDGTVSIIQPLIAPLYDGKSAQEILDVFQRRSVRSGHEILRSHWREKHSDNRSFDEFWDRILHDGVIEGTEQAVQPVSLKEGLRETEPSPPGRPLSQNGGLEVIFRPDPTVYDGRFANNGWLQELPKPLTKLTWDNAAMVSPRTAEALGLASEELVELRCGGKSVRAPVWILPGQADGCVTVHLGYGRTASGRVGSGAGFDAFRIRLSDGLWTAQGLEIRKTGERYALAATQNHHLIDPQPGGEEFLEERHLIRSATLEEYNSNPHFAQEGSHAPGPENSLYPAHPYEGHSWGMAINLGACVGCNACVTACQSENNIPVVGKEQVRRGREMHWIRIDRYYKGGASNPEMFNQPVLCMHCENAPCEPVCPVGATVHSKEGLNEMVYNRCVGTRYCSNNCPYKVRRFNFLLYSDFETPSLKLLHNPDVTVRSRGVMEKCTYCVQRINAARIEAEKDNRSIRDGEVRTACQQVCPTEAILFGDINDPDSQVSKVKSHPLNYGLLEELNTRPRTTYGASLKNPNPVLETDS